MQAPEQLAFKETFNSTQPFSATYHTLMSTMLQHVSSKYTVGILQIATLALLVNTAACVCRLDTAGRGRRPRQTPQVSSMRACGDLCAVLTQSISPVTRVRLLARRMPKIRGAIADMHYTISLPRGAHARGPHMNAS